MNPDKDKQHCRDLIMMLGSKDFNRIAAFRNWLDPETPIRTILLILLDAGFREVDRRMIQCHLQDIEDDARKRT